MTGSSLPRLRPRRLVVAASIIMDVAMFVDSLPSRGGDRIARRSLIAPGGGFNLIAAAARLGLPVAYGGLVGDGVFGRRIEEALRGFHAELLTPPVPGDSGFDIALVERDGERTFVTAPGCEAAMTRDHLTALPLREDDAVYASGYDLLYPGSGPALADWLPRLPKELLFVFDPGPLVAEIPGGRLQAALDRADILSLNHREGTLLTGLEEPGGAVHALTGRLGPDALALLRDGAHGAYIASRGRPPLHAPGRPARVMDTTGAGDVHTAALIARLAAGCTLDRALREANVAASLSVEREGPSESPMLAELLAEVGQGW